MPLGGRICRQMRVGSDFLPTCLGRQAARAASYRSEGPREGRSHGHDHANEMMYAFNQGDKFRLAIVFVGEGDTVEGPHYICNPFDREPGWGVASINFNLGDLLARAEAQ